MSPEVAKAFHDIRDSFDKSIIKTAKDSDNHDSMINILIKYPHITAELLRNPEYVRTLEVRIGSKIRSDSANDANMADGYFIKDSYAKPEAIYLLAYDVAALVEKTGLKLLDPLEFGLESEDGSASESAETSYINMLNLYKSSCDSINSYYVVKRVYFNDSVEHYQYQYHKLTSFDSEDNPVFTYAACDESTKNVGKCQDQIAAHGDTMELMLNDQVNYDKNLYDHAEIMLDYYKKLDVDSLKIDNSNKNVIAGLANTFKKLAWSRTDTAWRANKVTIVGAVLYATLVAQSLIFFIAYTKRLFYVIVLIVMAPIVVVMDFFNKFTS